MNPPSSSALPVSSRLPRPDRAETAVVQALGAALDGALHWPSVVATAAPWVQAVRDNPPPFWAMESLLRDYPISGAEGLALMRLAEALLRVPDLETAVALTADQLGSADFTAREGGAHPLVGRLTASAIGLSKRFLPDGGGDGQPGLLQRLGAQAVVAATVRAIQLMGRQFVLGRSIEEALGEAADQRRTSNVVYSYDMLGEGARTEVDAERYLASYLHAIDAIAGPEGRGAVRTPESSDGISIKLSALYTRYEEAQRARVAAVLLPRIWQLVERAAHANVNLTIDAEEADRLELSLDIVDALAARVAAELPAWRGFGLAVQAYQSRSLATCEAVARIARAHGVRLMVRLVKGAYWDGEIKRAQEQGLPEYPVYTRKTHTDLSYLACARALLAETPGLYPQFATHNAGTIAAILQLGSGKAGLFELQRLHGMGEGIYREVLPAASVPLRIYAPVGEHRDLLAYLVRRLLENGANSSFVHQLADPTVPVETLLASPLDADAAPGLPLPAALYGWNGRAGRRNSEGLDLSVASDRAALLQRGLAGNVPSVPESTVADVDKAMAHLAAAHAGWAVRPIADRAALLRRAADALQAALPDFCGLLVQEAHKTWGDCVSEVREAIDFCRYYADQAETTLAPQALPGPTGESNELRLHGRGVFVCISPWNFPLAIFAGQVVAALVAGNTVAAKPAEQTPAVAAAFIGLLRSVGVPDAVAVLLHGPGETIGAALVADRRTAGVCFTGSTPVARAINRALAAKDGPIVPLIAETGGINAMLVDSSALPEQVVDAVVQSAFRSAGQRCSALRLLCVHADIADAVIAMVAGAMQALTVGDPARVETDVGPVIDAEAQAGLAAQVARLRRTARLVGEAPSPTVADARWHFVAPVAFEVDKVADVHEEVFGPVLHIVRWRGDAERTVAEVNALGYGLTFGIQTRIDSRAERLAAVSRAGNVYVNRNMIGAVVGVQPFGGEGLSGTGPKAGGPNYLPRFCGEQTVTINTAAAGGNAELLTGG